MNKKLYFPIALFALILAVASYLVMDSSLFERQARRKIANELDGQLLSEGQQNKWMLISGLSIEVRADSIDIVTELPRTLCPPNSTLTLTFAADGILVTGEPPKIHHTIECIDEILAQMGGNRFTTPKNLFLVMHQSKEASSGFGVMRSENLSAMMAFPADWRLREFAIVGEAKFSVNPYELEKVRPGGLVFRVAE